MSSQDAFFKIRPTKRSNPEARTTLDCLHQRRIQTILEKESALTNIKDKLDSSMPQFANALWFSIDNQTTGVIFRLDPYKLEEIITKAIK